MIFFRYFILAIVTRFLAHFGDLADTCLDRYKKQKPTDVLFITMSAFNCGCDEWVEIRANVTKKCIVCISI